MGRKWEISSGSLTLGIRIIDLKIALLAKRGWRVLDFEDSLVDPPSLRSWQWYWDP